VPLEIDDRIADQLSGPWNVTSPPRSTSNSSTPRAANNSGDARRCRSLAERPSVTTRRMFDEQQHILRDLAGDPRTSDRALILQCFPVLEQSKPLDPELRRLTHLNS
jgi:hypothetical protein